MYDKTKYEFFKKLYYETMNADDYRQFKASEISDLQSIRTLVEDFINNPDRDRLLLRAVKIHDINEDEFKEAYHCIDVIKKMIRDEYDWEYAYIAQCLNEEYEDYLRYMFCLLECMEYETLGEYALVNNEWI